MTRDSDAKKLVVPFASGVGATANPNLFDGTGNDGVNWASGFPSSYEAIAGTTNYPTREQFNSLFRLITALAAEINRRGVTLEWDADLAYEDNALVMHNGVLYQATAAVAAGGNAPPATPWGLLLSLASETVAGLVELASSSEVMGFSDRTKAVTPYGLGIGVDRKSAGILDWRGHLQYRLHDLVVGSDGTLYQAQRNVAVNQNPVGRTNGDDDWREWADTLPAATVAFHDVTVAVGESAFDGSVVDTRSTLGTNASARIFQPILVAARANNDYPLNAEVVTGMRLSDDIRVRIRPGDTSFRVLCDEGDVEVPVLRPQNGVYLFDQGRPSSTVFRIGTSGIAATELGAISTHLTATTYWDDGTTRRILILSNDNDTIYSLPTPRDLTTFTTLGTLPSRTFTGDLGAMAAHRVGSELRLYLIGGMSDGPRLFRVNPDDVDSTTAPYGIITGANGILPSGTRVSYTGMTSHNNRLYAVQRTGAVGSYAWRLLEVNLANPSASSVVGTLSNGYQALFSWKGNLYGLTSSGQLRRFNDTSPLGEVLEISVHLGSAGFTGAAVATGYPETEDVTLGNGSSVDWNLKIRYAA